jgi:hypothetical protein
MSVHQSSAVSRPKLASKDEVPVQHIVWNRCGIHADPIFKYTLTLDKRRGRLCNHPILGPEIALKPGDPVQPSAEAAVATAKLFETLSPITAPCGILTRVPIWANQGMLAGIDYMKDIPIDCSHLIKKFTTPVHIPPLVFPNGTLNQVLAAQDKCRPFFVVYKGFQVGVYTTFEHGAKTAVQGCDSYGMHRYALDYQSVCRMFCEEVQNGRVCNFCFEGPVKLCIK